MSNSLREFVATLTHEELWGVHESYTEFEDKGSIGDAPCRVLATRYLQEQGMWSNDSAYNHIAMWMHQLAFEVYRRRALASW